MEGYERSEPHMSAHWQTLKSDWVEVDLIPLSSLLRFLFN